MKSKREIKARIEAYQYLIDSGNTHFQNHEVDRIRIAKENLEWVLREDKKKHGRN